MFLGYTEPLRASVAQGIEHRSPKAGVVRSNRIGGTTDFLQAIGFPGGLFLLVAFATGL